MGARLDRDAEATRGIEVFEVDEASRDIEVDVGRGAANGDLIRTDLGEGEGATQRGADGAVEARTFRTADIKAAVVGTEGRITGESDVENARRCVVGTAVAVGQGTAGGPIVQGVTRTGEDKAEVASTVRRVTQGLGINVEGGAGGDGHEGVITECRSRTELQRASIDGDATREGAITTDRQDTRPSLSQGNGASGVVDIRSEGEGGRITEGKRGGRADRVIDDFTDSVTSGRYLRQREAIEVKETGVHLQRARIGTEGTRRTRRSRTENHPTIRQDSGTGEGARPREGSVTHARLVDITRARNWRGEGVVAAAVQGQAGPGCDDDVGAGDIARRTAEADLQGTARDVGVARVRIVAREGGGAGARLGDGEFARAICQEAEVDRAADIVAAKGQRRGRGRTIRHGTRQGRRGVGEAADGLIETREVEDATVRIDYGAVIDLVGTRTSELHDATRVDVAGIADGVERAAGVLSEDHCATVDAECHAVVVRLRTRLVRNREGVATNLGDGAAARDRREDDIARAADGERTATGDVPLELGHGGRGVDDSTLPGLTDTDEGGEGLGGRLTVEVNGAALCNHGATCDGTERARVSEFQDALVDGGGTSVAVEASQDDGADAPRGVTDDDVIGVGQDRVDGQHRATTAEAVAARARRIIIRQRIQGCRRRRPNHEGSETGRVQVEGVSRIGRECQGTRGTRRDTARVNPSGEAIVRTRSHEGTRVIDGDQVSGRAEAVRTEGQRTARDNRRARIRIRTGEDHATLRGVEATAGSDDEVVRTREVRGDRQAGTATTQGVGITSRG